MVWKTWSSGGYSEPSPPRAVSAPRERKDGNLIALVGSPIKGRVSNEGNKEQLEKIYRIDDNILAYNLGGRLALFKSQKNDLGFDVYIGLPFTKGVTERVTGRTLVILGSNAHHIESMQGQFEGVVWQKNELDELKRYGDTIRWINVGDTRHGFVGLDYDSQAQKNDGVAVTNKDISFLAKTLIDFGYDSQKRLFLLKPPYITESQEGITLRQRGFETLEDYSCRVF